MNKHNAISIYFLGALGRKQGRLPGVKKRNAIMREEGEATEHEAGWPCREAAPERGGRRKGRAQQASIFELRTGKTLLNKQHMHGSEFIALLITRKFSHIWFLSACSTSLKHNILNTHRV